MSYIGVAPQDQENFQHKVVEAQIDFSNYIYPDSKESYWATVDRYWPQIKDIVLMFTYLDPDDLDKWAKEILKSQMSLMMLGLMPQIAARFI
jgi:hypothetical protein